MTLDVFHQRYFHHRRVIIVTNNNGHCFQFGFFRGAPAAFTGNDLVFAAMLAHHQRLNNTVQLNGFHQLGQLIRIKKPAGVDAGWE